ncbi:MAG: Ribonuclease [Acidimicrobiales bacterium]|nr:Ribonuclease [Acidimicrobiales bacterium]
MTSSDPEPDAGGRGRAAASPGDIPPKGWKDILARVLKRTIEDNVSLAAAGVAYYGFMALIPALAAGISIYGLLVTPAEAAAKVGRLFGTLPSEARKLLQDQVRTIAGSSATGLSITAAVGVAAALWAASSGIAHLMVAVNQAYGEKHTRKFLKQRLIALALTIGALILVGLVVVGIGVVPAAVAKSSLPAVARLAIDAAAWLGVAALFLVALAVLYRYAPERDEPKWSWVTTGSVIGLALWFAATLGLRLYTAGFGSYNKTYGALAGVVLLLLWLYVSALAVLLGAEINAEMEHQTVKDTTEGEPRPMGERGAHMADTLGKAS